MLRKPEKRWSVKSLYTLSFDVISKNLNIYANDDSLQYLTPRIKDNLIKSLSYSFWRQTTSKNVFALLVHSKLEIIDLTNTHLDDDLLRTLEICKRLQIVYLIRGGSYSITREELVRFFQNKSDLQMLQLRNCDIVDDSVLKCISECCQKITTLDFKGCKKITDEGLKFLRLLKCLECVSLSDTMITNDGLIEFIKEPTGKLLKELMLGNCIHIKTEGLLQVSSYCPNLRTFVFNNCECTEDMALLYQEQSNLKNLKQITWTVPW